MQAKGFDFKKFILIAALVFVGLLAFRFLMPANCSALVQDAQSVSIGVMESANVNGQPEISTCELNLQTGDRALIELKNLFTEYNCFYTLKTQDSLNFDFDKYRVQVDDAALSFHITVSDGENTRYFTIGGKYIVSGDNVWRIGLNKQKAEEFQLRLYEFVTEHKEATDE